MKSMLTGIIQIFILMFISTGCVNTELISDIDPAADLSALKSFYVMKFGPDEKGVESIIANELSAMGYVATSGNQTTPPHPVDAVVSYRDKWMWDITMYMIELKVDLRDPKTNYQFATARSYRTSLARTSPEEMVREVLGKLLANQKGAGK